MGWVHDTSVSHHIFAVDDDPSLLRLISLYLTTEGFEVAAFGSPVDALREIVDPAPPNPTAVVLDLNMPEMDGREFYRRAREAGLTAPVLILSAFGADDARRELGADAAMSKPFDPDRLTSAVRRMLSADPSPQNL
jgi:DNA-binding response OmpR family regulator